MFMNKIYSGNVSHSLRINKNGLDEIFSSNSISLHRHLYYFTLF